jgi:hypothetical protein
MAIRAFTLVTPFVPERASTEGRAVEHIVGLGVLAYRLGRAETTRGAGGPEHSLGVRGLPPGS